MPFHGFLDRWTLRESVLELRFSSGAHEPEEGEIAVLYATVDAPVDVEAIEKRLTEIEPYETEVVVENESSTGITVQLDYGDPIILKGARVSVRPSPFEAEDYARIARLHQQWGDSLNNSLTAAHSRIESAKHLLEDQMHRLAEKVKSHESGSTARTLYEQQTSFIARVLSKLDT